MRISDCWIRSVRSQVSPVSHALRRAMDSNGISPPLHSYSSAPAPALLPSRSKNLSSHGFLSTTGQINRAKNQAAGIAPTPPSYVPTRRTFDQSSLPFFKPTTEHDLTRKPAYGHARGRGGYYRGSIARGGYRVGKPPTHRHRSLILNGATPSNPADDSGPVSASTSASVSASSPSWVTKSDRHLQLINTSIYQEHADARAKAIEQTRLQHMRQKENRERNRLMNHLTRSGVTSAVSTDPTSAPVYEIVVDGIKFAVVKGGSKLVKVPGALLSTANICFQILTRSSTGDANAPKLTPKVAVVGGVKFYRTKNGNMYRHAAVRAQRYVTHSGDGPLLTTASYRRSGAVSKVNVPCNKFSNTGIFCSATPFVFLKPGLRHVSELQPRPWSAITNHRLPRFLPQRPRLPLYPRLFQGFRMQESPAKGLLCFWRPV